MTEQVATPGTRRTLRNRLLILLLLILLAAGLITTVPGLRGVEHELARVKVGWLVLAVVLELLSGHGYVYSFAVVFRRRQLGFARRMPWLHFVSRVAWMEQGFQAVVPAGGAAAEVPGALVLRARGMPWGWIVQRSTVLFLLTSAINAIVISVFGLGVALGLFSTNTGILGGLIPGAVGIGVLALFALLPGVLDAKLERRTENHGHRRPPRWLPDALGTRMTRGFADAIRDVRAILFAFDWRLLGPFAYLAFDIAVLGVCFAALGVEVPLATLVLGYQVGYLSDLIPVPGGIGSLDGGLIAALVLYGVGATSAAAAVLLYHAIALSVPLVVGFVAFLLLPRTFVDSPR